MNRKPPCSIQWPQGGIFMKNIYDISYKGETVGEAVLTKEGLMYKIHCFCRLPQEDAYQVILTAASAINLGILAKEEGGLGLTKRLAIKQLANETPKFEAILRSKKTEQEFHKIEAGKPFDHLDQLKNAALEERDGSLGILVNPEAPAQEILGNDPSPEFEDGSAPEECGCLDPER